ncbi:hypothetical protein CRN39_02345, partial [Vibrio vulnificus]
MPLGVNKLARLAHKDQITVGPYRLRVLLGNELDIEEQHGSLELLFSSQQEDLLANLELEYSPEMNEIPLNTD